MKASLCNLCKHEHWLGEAHVLPNAVQRSTIQKAPVTLTPIRAVGNLIGFSDSRIGGPAEKPLSLNVTKSKRGRPQLSDHKLTPAERKRRQRAKQVKA